MTTSSRWITLVPFRQDTTSKYILTGASGLKTILEAWYAREEMYEIRCEVKER
jgi:hypothetical protein